jgi:hypothetical protein
MPSPSLELVLSRLPRTKRSRKGWSAKCPVHNGVGKTSLSISEGEDGRALLKCFAGCPVEGIVGAIGLTMADLFDRRNGDGEGDHRRQKTFERSNTSKKSSVKTGHST